MSLNHKLPKKIDFKPKKRHGFQVILWILGLLLPPLAVAVRFGIGVDFFINVFLCICGYIPCHFHNFYIQNIRNNHNRARTPKWAIKHGLVDNSERERQARKNQWSKRFDERNNHSTLADQELEEGEEGANYDPTTTDPREVERRRNEGLWNNEEEEYYNADRAPNQKSWHYPANFEGTVGDGRSHRKKVAASSNNQWQQRPRRSSASSSIQSNTYPPVAATEDDVPEWGKDYGSKSRNNKPRKNTLNKKQDHGHDWARNPEYGQSGAGGNDGGRGSSGNDRRSNGQSNKTNGDPNWDHEF